MMPRNAWLILVAVLGVSLRAATVAAQDDFAVERSAALLVGVFEYRDRHPALSARYRIQAAEYGSGEFELAVMRAPASCTVTLNIGRGDGCTDYHAVFYGSLTYGPSFRMGRLRPFAQLGLGAAVSPDGDFDGGVVGNAGLGVRVTRALAVRAEAGRRFEGRDRVTHFLCGVELMLPHS